MKTITHIVYPSLAALALACFALSPAVRAVDPPPDGGYPGGNTAEGDDALFSLTTGNFNTAIGFQALYNNTSGGTNTATGVWALLSNIGGAFNTANGTNTMISNDNGGFNAAFGSQALFSNTSGSFNTAVGWNALYSNQMDNTTAVGAYALFSLTTGVENTAIGFEALYSITGNVHNTAVGYQALANNIQDDNEGVGWHALFNNTTGYGNHAFGVDTLGFNTTGSFNTATGFRTLNGNTTGSYNTATGYNALQGNTSGDFNTANGESALANNTTACCNTAIGEDALVSNTDGNWNTAVGINALISFTTGSVFGNTALGAGAGSNLTSGDNNIYIKNEGVSVESNVIRIGTQGTQTNTYIAGISGTTISRGAPVFVDANGRLGTRSSSQRFKDGIKPMDKASEAILALKPVTFHYKKEIDPDATPQFGLMAEAVEKINPDLVARDADGKAYTVRYDAVNAMLLNEFLKEHRTVQEQQKEIDALKAELKEQRAFIQKVSDKVELNRPAPQTVLNNPR